jgi:hypothetical protein
MQNAVFDEFVKSQQEPTDPEIDWNLRRDEWLQHLEELYSQIHQFLKEYIESGQMQFESRPIELSEDYIGSYEARQVNLRIGRKLLKFQPVGTLLLGSKGRVDVIGPGVTAARLVLIDSKVTRASDLARVHVGEGSEPSMVPKSESRKIKWEWKMVTRPPERRFIELTQETFFQMIMEVANG